MWRWLLILVILSGVAAGLVLGVLNPDEITLELAFFELKASLGAVVSVAAGLGLLIGLCIGILLCAGRRRSPASRSIDGNSAPGRRPDA